MPDKRKFLLDESKLPKDWYNIISDLPFPLPVALNPATLKPISPEDLAPIFPMELIKQEVSQERYIPIPEEVLEIYRLWRPTPLFRAINLEKYLDTPAHIYYKYEGGSPPGSHKPNTAVAQAFYNKMEGVKRLTTETGAGQWGSALAMACNFFNLECKVYMVKVSYYQKPYRRSLIEVWGAKVVPSPSQDTEAGRRILEQDPDSPGALGVAISEAVEDAVKRDDTKYSLGSVLNHVLLHQTIIGEEALMQMEMAGEFPDVVIGCVGGGSNFAGISFPFVREKFKGKKIRFIAVEPESCPSLTKGLYTYDFGDVAKATPLLKMYTLGHNFMPPAIHAGGLRYHGVAPLVSALHQQGYIEARACPQLRVFEAGITFAKTEGILPAPEANHAIRVAIDEALDAKEKGEKRVILFNLSGNGFFDLSAYDQYLSGKLEDYFYPKEKIEESLKNLPKV
ncbi:MAG TPA: TrpB-like pyridoxal phosphate-dependent enzyme [Dictyoglomaceae bacterium]|nr:TrpB-like pyridoxal phosphate-dependent enzyme [Dictyoglomaceae bacterium]HOL38873.1 TrpB-like pyridoxal phosphate-dependent enzyme [Dictyoglomaceae bacterium]HOP94939.1 TrpB-like pyridoxal phosphate-dependent enzyme [Dictyoglomaceae bacterium]HPP15710.1 TrpB-like pyridoxal phosphate-dependent enzyme [Dictyoglomaceae bacterium]HPU43549.1 TrpB-like pyridoxal phosphate-dependent enzyme [Dictyoglomaceae bacterium]